MLNARWDYRLCQFHELCQCWCKNGSFDYVDKFLQKQHEEIYNSFVDFLIRIICHTIHETFSQRQSGPFGSQKLNIYGVASWFCVGPSTCLWAPMFQLPYIISNEIPNLGMQIWIVFWLLWVSITIILIIQYTPKNQGADLLILVLYVEDLILIGSSSSMTKAIQQALMK